MAAGLAYACPKPLRGDAKGAHFFPKKQRLVASSIGRRRDPDPDRRLLGRRSQRHLRGGRFGRVEDITEPCGLLCSRQQGVGRPDPSAPRVGESSS